MPPGFTEASIPLSVRPGVSLTARTHAVQPPASGERPALEVDRVGAGQLVQPAPLGRIVHDLVGREHRRRLRAGDAERPALPEHRAFGVDHAGRVEHGAGGEAVAQRACEPERDDRPLGHAVRGAEPDERRARAGATGDPPLRPRGAGEGHPVSVHAALRTLSRMLPAAANAADGSNPEWIAQCSQRASLPGPYSSHSIPSSSAS